MTSGLGVGTDCLGGATLLLGRAAFPFPRLDLTRPVEGVGLR